jgi:RNA polymerase sigma-70 factor, ECF subfamily
MAVNGDLSLDAASLRSSFSAGGHEGDAASERSAFASAFDSQAVCRLLERCQAGDQKAWTLLFREHEKPVYRFALKLCGNAEDANDIMVHVFLRIYQSLHTFRHEASFSSWVARIVRNTYLDMCIRPSWRKLPVVDNGLHDSLELVSFASDPAPGPEAVCLQNERTRLLQQAISHLPPYQREVLSMYHGEGKSYEEIASTVGISIGTVKSRLNRARRMLLDRLECSREMLVAR